MEINSEAGCSQKSNESVIISNINPTEDKTLNKRRRRKLYTPTDHFILNEKVPKLSESEDIPIKINPYASNKEIENIHKKANINKWNKPRKPDGKTPIRAQVDSNEKPPGVELLGEQIEARRLDFSDLNETNKNYYDSLFDDRPLKKSKSSSKVESKKIYPSEPSTSRVIAGTPRSWNAENTKTNLELADFTETILQKLDTTVMEMDHNTDRTLQKLIMEMQKRLDNEEDRQIQIRRKAAEDLKEKVDASFQLLDHKELVNAECLTSEMREKSRMVLQEDRSRKADMIASLEEDIRSGRLAHEARQRNKCDE